LTGAGREEAISCETQGTKQTTWLHSSPSKRQGLVTVTVVVFSLSASH